MFLYKKSKITIYFKNRIIRNLLINKDSGAALREILSGDKIGLKLKPEGAL